VAFVIGGSVWFKPIRSDGKSFVIKIGEEKEGVSVLETNPPWSVKLGYREGTYDVALFERIDPFEGATATTSRPTVTVPGLVSAEPAAPALDGVTVAAPAETPEIDDDTEGDPDAADDETDEPTTDPDAEDPETTDADTAAATPGAGEAAGDEETIAGPVKDAGIAPDADAGNAASTTAASDMPTAAAGSEKPDPSAVDNAPEMDAATAAGKPEATGTETTTTDTSPTGKAKHAEQSASKEVPPPKAEPARTADGRPKPEPPDAKIDKPVKPDGSTGSEKSGKKKENDSSDSRPKAEEAPKQSGDRK
jgi:hypothetical protein